MAIELVQALFVMALFRVSGFGRIGPMTVGTAVGFGTALLLTPGHTLGETFLRGFVAMFAASLLDGWHRESKHPMWMLLVASMAVGTLVGWQPA